MKLFYILLFITALGYSQRGDLYKNSPKETYYKNGGLRVKREFRNGTIKNYTTYYKSGALRSYYVFNEKGEHDSIANFYFPNGKIKTEWIYKRDVVKKRTDYDQAGKVIKGKKNYDRIKMCNSNLMHDRNNLNWIYRRANTNLSLDYYDEAIEDFEFLNSKLNFNNVRSSPKKRLYHNIAIAYGAIDDYENCLKYNFKALSIEPKNQALLNNIGYLFFRVKDYDLAMDYLNRCHEVNPENYYAFFGKALIYLEQGDIKKAHEFIDKTISDERSHKHLAHSFDDERNIWTTSAEIHIKEGNNAKAINDLNKALKNNNVNSYAYKCLGDVYSSMNSSSQACGYYSIALKYNYDKVHNSPEFRNIFTNICSNN